MVSMACSFPILPGEGLPKGRALECKCVGGGCGDRFHNAQVRMKGLSYRNFANTKPFPQTYLPSHHGCYPPSARTSDAVFPGLYG